MNLNKLEGRTVREIEGEHLNGGMNYRMLFALGAGAIFVLLMFLIGWQINLKIANLRVENNNLVAENTALKEEVSELKTQLAGIKMAEKLLPQDTQPKGTIQNEYIYYEIRPKDTFGDISNKYYGVPIYGPALAKFNGLSVKTMLQVGQVIKVPIKPDKLKK
ncbi:LysM peptidoglycan-binding domain-containing protein [Desulfotruncus alcoholivorax]|uniref:LysM peptidoglycan-binding domain-containing protein n=1 Tax=Desulfotruncus alcoholivorax TaxID=265477 RepID=UPI000425448B|nr:LysM peptidoglycan-binding domain-containing protein [Desulfotruncus alcoholivorax]